MHAFGTNFIVTNSARQTLDPTIFQNGPWMHLATVVRGFRTYMAFTHVNDHKKTYVEVVDEHDPNVFIQIADHSEWQDVYCFLRDQGLLSMENFNFVSNKKK